MTAVIDRRPRIVLAALLIATAALYLVNLSASGYGNLFYAAAAQAGAQSWSAWFFGSLDAHNFITVDKPPASLWVTGLAVRLFGMNTWSVLAPQALMGAASVGVLYATVRRAFGGDRIGTAAGLLAGAALAGTPAAALIFRFNNPDALLALVLTVAAYCLTRAVATASWRWLALTGVAMGVAFLTKMFEGFLPLPGFALTYLLVAPTSWRHRLVHLLAAAGALVAAAGWWVLAVALIPPTQRPYIGGSTDNTVLQLAVGYNGMSRILGHKRAVSHAWSRLGGMPGPHRLFTAEMANEVSWLLPAALLAAAFGVYLLLRSRLGRGEKAALTMFTGWLLVSGLVFSYMDGMVHPYYTVAMAPAVAGLVGIGAAWAWRDRARWDGRVVLAAMIAMTAAWSAILLHRNAFWPTWLTRCLVVVAVVAAVTVLGLGARRLGAAGVAVGVLAAGCGTVAYAIATATTPHHGTIPTALASTAGPPHDWTGDEASNAQLAKELAATTTEWSAATNGSQSAAALEISSGTPVMAIGGWSGDPVPTLQTFIDDVRAGRITYYIEAGRRDDDSEAGRRDDYSEAGRRDDYSEAGRRRDTPGGGHGEVIFGPNHTGTHTREIAEWVAKHYPGTVIGQTTVYRLT
ncbi:glycosyl transferase [Mycolicibacterium agri]|nr:glycosyltransferase family 39 protein [Mycolicibacterium agri]PEG41504.1 glycosyl transferase [Mycolicibacterium agri]